MPGNNKAVCRHDLFPAGDNCIVADRQVAGNFCNLLCPVRINGRVRKAGDDTNQCFGCREAAENCHDRHQIEPGMRLGVSKQKDGCDNGKINDCTENLCFLFII